MVIVGLRKGMMGLGLVWEMLLVVAAIEEGRHVDWMVVIRGGPVNAGTVS
jgi:hypothetical protein